MKKYISVMCAALLSLSSILLGMKEGKSRAQGNPFCKLIQDPLNHSTKNCSLKKPLHPYTIAAFTRDATFKSGHLATAFSYGFKESTGKTKISIYDLSDKGKKSVFIIRKCVKDLFYLSDNELLIRSEGASQGVPDCYDLYNIKEKSLKKYENALMIRDRQYTAFETNTGIIICGLNEAGSLSKLKNSPHISSLRHTLDGKCRAVCFDNGAVELRKVLPNASRRALYNNRLQQALVGNKSPLNDSILIETD